MRKAGDRSNCDTETSIEYHKSVARLFVILEGLLLSSCIKIEFTEKHFTEDFPRVPEKEILKFDMVKLIHALGIQVQCCQILWEKILFNKAQNKNLLIIL